MSNNYKPTKWLGGKTIGTAQVMNNIEQGISNAHDRLDNVENDILSAHNRLNNVDSQIKYKANKTTTDNIQQQLNNLVLENSGDSNAEVVQARGEYSTLNERISNIKPDDVTFLNRNGYVDGTINLYDKDNSDDRKLTVSSTGLTIVPASTLTSFVLQINPNVTYTLEKMLSNRFWFATTTDEPNQGVSINLQCNIANKTKHTFTSLENDKYLLVVYYKTDDTNTINEIRDTIKVYEGGEWIEEVEGTLECPNLLTTIDNLPSFLLPTLSYKPLGVVDKGYVCLIADDGHLRFIDTILPILQDKDVPYTLALMKDSPIFNDANRETNKTIIKELVDSGKCSVCYHGGVSYTEYSSAELINFFKTEKIFFNSFGVEPVGCCFPNHDYSELTKTIAGNITGICCGGNNGTYYTGQLNGARSNIYHLARTSVVSYGLDNLKRSVNLAIEKKQLFIVFWHDVSIANNSDYKQILNDFIDYAKTTSIEFITLDKLLNMI